MSKSLDFKQRTSREQNEALELYLPVLEEIRQRLDAIDDIVIGTRGTPEYITAELGFQQLRMVCDLVGIACLIAHGDMAIAKQSKLQRAWRPGDIMDELERLHANFFPKAFTANFVKGSHIEIEPLPVQPLSKDQLLALYVECGDALHRGSLRRMFDKSKPKTPPQVGAMLEWRDRVRAQLRSHIIASVGGKEQLIAFLDRNQGHPEGGFATVPEVFQSPAWAAHEVPRPGKN